MTSLRVFIIFAAIVFSGSVLAKNESSSCKQSYVLLGGLCHSYESLEGASVDIVNPYNDGKELTPELSVMIIQLMPENITRFFDSYFGSHVSFMKADELLKWDLSVRDYLSYLSYVPVQLDISDVPEIFILDQSPGNCGAGGCSGFILDLDASASGDVIGTVFYTGTIVKPIIGPAPPPESGYYDFAVVSDEGIKKYSFDKLTKSY